MRVKLALTWNDQNTNDVGSSSNSRYIDTRYRRRILSLIKEAFNLSSPQFKQAIYPSSGNVYKPFTFAIYLPVDKEKQQKSPQKGMLALNNNSADLVFSSSEYEYIMHFANGIQKKKEYNIGFYDTELNNNDKKCQKEFTVKIGSPVLLPTKEFMQNTAIFYLSSPAVFHFYADNNRIKHASYGTPEHELAVSRHLKAKVKKAFSHYTTEQLEAIKVQWEMANNVLIPHYEEHVSAVSGFVKISAPPEVLNLFYNTGLGARTAQGFGFLDEPEAFAQFKEREATNE